MNFKLVLFYNFIDIKNIHTNSTLFRFFGYFNVKRQWFCKNTIKRVYVY